MLEAEGVEEPISAGEMFYANLCAKPRATLFAVGSAPNSGMLPTSLSRRSMPFPTRTDAELLLFTAEPTGCADV